MREHLEARDSHILSQGSVSLLSDDERKRLVVARIARLKDERASRVRGKLGRELLIEQEGHSRSSNGLNDQIQLDGHNLIANLLKTFGFVRVVLVLESVLDLFDHIGSGCAKSRWVRDHSFDVTSINSGDRVQLNVLWRSETTLEELDILVVELGSEDRGSCVRDGLVTSCLDVLKHGNANLVLANATEAHSSWESERQGCLRSSSFNDHLNLVTSNVVLVEF